MIRVLITIAIMSLPGVDPYTGEGGRRALYCSDAIGFMADCKTEHAYEWTTFEAMVEGKDWLRRQAIRCIQERPDPCETPEGRNLPCVIKLSRSDRWDHAWEWCRAGGGAFLVEWDANGVVKSATCEIRPKP